MSPSARSAVMSEAPGCPKQIISLRSATSCTSDPPTSCAPIHKPDAPAGVSTGGGVAAGKRPSSLFRERAASYYNGNNSFSVFLHLPPALVRPGIDMHPAGAALGVGGVLRVTPDAAPGGQQGLGVGGDRGHVHALNVEVRRPAQQVLARLAAAHGRVVGSGAVAAGDIYRLAEVLPDALQQHYQFVVEDDDIAALAGKLPHLEVG